MSTARSGRPLDAAIRQNFESRFQHDLSDVRIHPDAQSEVDRVVPGARAVAVGQDIFFAKGEYAPNSEEGQQLLAHELTHVLQQGSATSRVDARMGSNGDRFETEAQKNAQAMRSGATLTSREQATHLSPQPDEENHGFFYRLLVRVFPEIEPILQRGVLNWIQDRVADAVQAVIDKLMAPVRAVAGIVPALAAHFTHLVDWLKKAASSLAKGDCSVLREAVDYIEQAVSGLISPILDKIKEFGKKIASFFTGLWERFLAPIWHEMENIGGKAWELIKRFANWIWEKTAKIREWSARAWRWVKNKLGIGEGPEGQNGLLQWVEEKAEKAWNWLKTKVEPIKKPLMVIGGILLLLSPVGPVIAVGAAVGGIIEGVRAIKRYFGTPNGVVSAREVLHNVVLPKLIKVIRGFAGLVTDKANALIGALRRARDTIREGATAAEHSIFFFLAGLFGWIADRLGDLCEWGDDKVAAFLQFINHVTEGMAGFLDRILNALEEIGGVLKDLMRLPFLLAGKVWKAIPACIRDPFIDFLGVQILGRIPVFKVIAGTPEAWAKTKAQVGQIIKDIFVNFDLIGAMKHVFLLLLRALDVPLELVEAVVGKLVQAWDTIKEKPVEFLKNIFATIQLAFRGFFKRILVHLRNGLAGWITNSLEGARIYWPQSWTSPGELFSFAASILGLSVEHIIERVALKYPAVAAGLRKAINVLTGAWEWLSLIFKGDYKALWEKIKEKLSDIGNMVMQSIMDFLMVRVIAGVTAQLAAAATPTVVSQIAVAIIDTYKTIKTVVKYMKKILTMVNSMLDSILNIAAGTLQPAADLIEHAMDAGMPVVIAWLAELVGLSDVGDGIKDAIETIRGKVDSAIDWLIDKAASAIQAIAGAVKGAVALLFPPEKFEMEGEQHTVSAEGSADHYGIYVQSEKRNLNDFTNYAVSRAKGTEKEESVNGDVQQLKSEYSSWQEEAAKVAQERDEQEQIKKQEESINDFKGIANLIKKIMMKLPAAVVYHTQFSTSGEVKSIRGFGTLGGTERVADPLTPDHPKGAAPGTANWDLWEAVAPGTKEKPNLRRGREMKALYYRGHLLSRWLGGGNEIANLTPITASANQKHESYVESLIIDLVGEGSQAQTSKKGMVYYKVEAVYDAGHREVPEGVEYEEGYLPRRLETVWWQLVPKPDIKRPDPGDASQLVQAGPEHRYTVENVPPYPEV